MPAPTSTGGTLMSYPASVDSTGVTPWTITTTEVMAGAAAGTLGANNVYCYVFELLTQTTFTGMKLDITTPATGTADCGLYDASGTLLVHSGATTLTVSTINSVSFPSTTLGPGRYIMACAPSNATDFYFRHTGMESNMYRGYLATNAASAGVLPATTGTLLTTTVLPAMSLIVSGGAP